MHVGFAKLSRENSKHQYYYIVCLMWMFYHPIQVQTLLRKLFNYFLSMHVDPRSYHERTIRCK